MIELYTRWVEGMLMVVEHLVPDDFSPVQTASSFSAGTSFRKVSCIGKNPAVLSGASATVILELYSFSFLGHDLSIM